MQPDMNLEGIDALNKQLKKLAQSMEPEEVEPMLLEGAQAIAEDARDRAPLGPTGNLKRSLTAKLLKRTGNMPPVAVAAVDRKIAPHAHLVEFGTSKAPAHPFFRPSVDTNGERVLTDLKDKLKDKIDHAVD